jgi:ABC-type transporter Mla subunit MlaD
MSNDRHQAEIVLSSVAVVVTAGFFAWVMKQHPVGELSIRPYELLALFPAVTCLYYFADKVVEQIRHKVRVSRVK